MQTEALKELFPLFTSASPETLETLQKIAVEHEYPTNRAVLMEDSWGNAVYFIASGWVKVRRHAGETVVTLAILGKGDFFGEMAILDESPRSTDVIALSPVKLLSISAQQFIQTLFNDSQLHHRMLQLMVKRLRQTNLRFQLSRQPAAIKLAHTLVTLARQYGTRSETGIQMFNIPQADLANIADIGIEDAQKIMEKLEDKEWIKVDLKEQTLCLQNERQLTHLSKKR